MDVLRTDFGAVDSSGLSGDAAAAETPVSNAGSPGLSGEAAAVEPPASDAGPPAAQCVSAAAQEALVQVRLGEYRGWLCGDCCLYRLFSGPTKECIPETWCCC